MHIIALNVLNLAFGHSFSLNAPLHVFQEDFLEAEDLANSQLLRLELDDLDVDLHVPSWIALKNLIRKLTVGMRL